MKKWLITYQQQNIIASQLSDESPVELWRKWKETPSPCHIIFALQVDIKDLP